MSLTDDSWYFVSGSSVMVSRKGRLISVKAGMRVHRERYANERERGD